MGYAILWLCALTCVLLSTALLSAWIARTKWPAEKELSLLPLTILCGMSGLATVVLFAMDILERDSRRLFEDLPSLPSLLTLGSALFLGVTLALAVRQKRRDPSMAALPRSAQWTGGVGIGIPCAAGGGFITPACLDRLGVSSRTGRWLVEAGGEWIAEEAVSPAAARGRRRLRFRRAGLPARAPGGDGSDRFALRGSPPGRRARSRETPSECTDPPRA